MEGLLDGTRETREVAEEVTVDSSAKECKEDGELFMLLMENEGWRVVGDNEIEVVGVKEAASGVPEELSL